MTIPDDLLDSLMKDYKNPEDLIGETGLLKQLTKQLLERAMQTEMTEHLGYEKNAPSTNKAGNSRNGSYQKKIKGEFGELDIAVPRDRDSSFEPVILPKGQSRFTGFDDKIIALYARGMTTRDIQAHLEEMYGVDISPTLVSQVTKAVQEEIILWQNRPLDEVWPIVHLDAIRVKVRQDNRVINKAVYLAVGVNLDGLKEVLGMWTAETEGAKFWLQVVTELKKRGIKDIFIACVDGLKGFLEVIERVSLGTVRGEMERQSSDYRQILAEQLGADAATLTGGPFTQYSSIAAFIYVPSKTAEDNKTALAQIEQLWDAESNTQEGDGLKALTTLVCNREKRLNGEPSCPIHALVACFSSLSVLQSRFSVLQ